MHQLIPRRRAGVANIGTFRRVAVLDLAQSRLVRQNRYREPVVRSALLAVVGVRAMSRRVEERSGAPGVAMRPSIVSCRLRLAYTTV